MSMCSKPTDPPKAAPKISCNGDGCAGESPICTAELAFPKGPMNDTSTRSRPWTTAPLLFCLTLLARPARFELPTYSFEGSEPCEVEDLVSDHRHCGIKSGGAAQNAGTGEDKLNTPMQIRMVSAESSMDIKPPAGPGFRGSIVGWSVVIFVAGLLVRLTLVLLTYGTTSQVGSEPVEIAISLATTGSYADAYGKGVGPTAYCAPLHPILLSALFRLFGTGSHGALAVHVFGSIAAALAFALLPALAVRSRLDLSTGVLAGMAGALLPVNYWAQTSGVFDAPFTGVALVVLCCLLCQTLRANRLTRSAC